MQLKVNSNPVTSVRWLAAFTLVGLTATDVGGQIAPKANYVAEKSFQLPAKGQLGAPDRPVAVAGGPDGSVHVADGRGLVVIYDSSGLYRRSYGKGQLKRPVALAVDEFGDAYVLDASRSQVIVFGPNGQPLRTIGAKGPSGGFLRNPIDMAMGPSGHVYILDTGRTSIEVFSRDGVFVRSIRPGDLAKAPLALAVGNDGSIYLADKSTPSQVLVFPPFIKLPWQGRVPRGGAARVEFRGAIRAPTALAVNPYGTVLVLDRQGGSLWGHNRWMEAPIGRNDVVYGGVGSGRGSFKEAVDIALGGPTDVLLLDARLRKVEWIRLTTEEGLSRRADFGYPVRVSKGAKPLPADLYAIAYGREGTPRFLMSAKSRGLTLLGSTAQLHGTVYRDTVHAFLPNPNVLGTHYSRLGSVAAAAMNDSMVVVIEEGRNRFMILGVDGTLKGSFGDNYRDARRLKNPNGVALMPDGQILICDTGNNRVKMFSPDLANLVGNYTFPGAFGVAVSPSGEVLAWSEDGKSVGRLTGGSRFAPVRPGLLPDVVAALAFDDADNLFAMDKRTQRITIIEAGFTRVLTQLGTERGLKNPNRIFLDKEGNIYIADPGAKRTVVYRWDIAFPPPADLKVAFERGAVVMSWAPGPERYVEEYQIQGAVEMAGPYAPIASSDSPSFRLDAAAFGESSIRYVRGSTVYISGAAGKGTEPYPLFNLTAAAAYAQGDYRAAIKSAREGLILIRDGVLEAGSAARGELLFIGFASAYALGDNVGALKWGEQVGGWAPPERRIEFPFKMAQAYLKVGNPRAASEQLLASVAASPRADFFRDPVVIDLTFSVYDALTQAGYETEAVNFLRFYTGSLPATVSDVRRAYEDSIVVRHARDKLEPGFRYWRNANYQDAMRFFEDMLLSGDLNAEQQVIARQILAAGYFAYGRRTEAEDAFREIYEIRPRFSLRSEIERLRTLYGLTIYNPETQRFFGALRPGP